MLSELQFACIIQQVDYVFKVPYLFVPFIICASIFHRAKDHLFIPKLSLAAPGSLQATRALMIVGIIVSIAGLGVACMGMKCTTCAGTDKLRKSRIAMTGGIILLVGGEDTYLYNSF